jgi:hypothetical protein
MIEWKLTMKESELVEILIKRLRVIDQFSQDSDIDALNAIALAAQALDSMGALELEVKSGKAPKIGTRISK